MLALLSGHLVAKFKIYGFYFMCCCCFTLILIYVIAWYLCVFFYFISIIILVSLWVWFQQRWQRRQKWIPLQVIIRFNTKFFFTHCLKLDWFYFVINFISLSFLNFWSLCVFIFGREIEEMCIERERHTDRGRCRARERELKGEREYGRVRDTIEWDTRYRWRIHQAGLFFPCIYIHMFHNLRILFLFSLKNILYIRLHWIIIEFVVKFLFFFVNSWLM